MKTIDEALIVAKVALLEIDNIDVNTDEDLKSVLELEAAQQGQINKLKKLKRKAERDLKIDAAFERMNDIFFEGIRSGNLWRDLAVVDLALEELRELQADETDISHYQLFRKVFKRIGVDQ